MIWFFYATWIFNWLPSLADNWHSVVNKYPQEVGRCRPSADPRHRRPAVCITTRHASSWLWEAASTRSPVNNYQHHNIIIQTCFTLPSIAMKPLSFTNFSNCRNSDNSVINLSPIFCNRKIIDCSWTNTQAFFSYWLKIVNIKSIINSHCPVQLDPRLSSFQSRTFHTGRRPSRHWPLKALTTTSHFTDQWTLVIFPLWLMSQTHVDD